MNVVKVESVGRLVPVNEQSSYECVVQTVLENKEDENEDGINCLTFSLKEELEEMKESFVFSVRPEQMIP